MLQRFKNLMARVASFKEFVSAGNKLPVSFQQGLEMLRRPQVNRDSELVEKVIKANESKRVLSYFEAWCITVHDSMQRINNLKTILDESECILADATLVLQTTKKFLLPNEDIDPYDGLHDKAIVSCKMVTMLIQRIRARSFTTKLVLGTKASCLFKGFEQKDS